MIKLVFNIKLILEFGPLVTFFLTYKLSQSNILLATAWIMISSVICFILRYFIIGSISLSLLFSSAILIVAGGVTLITGDSSYIKMKPTFVFAGFAFATYIGMLFKKFFIKDVIENGIRLRYRHWRALSLRVAFYFLFLAIINEFTWRFFSEEFWVNFKLFGISGLSVLFVLLQIQFIEKHKITGERR